MLQASVLSGLDFRVPRYDLKSDPLERKNLAYRVIVVRVVIVVVVRRLVFCVADRRSWSRLKFW